MDTEKMQPVQSFVLRVGLVLLVWVTAANRVLDAVFDFLDPRASTRARPCYGCIDRLCWYLWPQYRNGFRPHSCTGSGVPFAKDWAPEGELYEYWLEAFALPEGSQ